MFKVDEVESSVSVLIKELEKNIPTTIRLFLDLTVLSESDVNHLASAIASHQYLEYLNIFDTNMTPKQHEKIIAALKENQSVTTLVIDKDIGDHLYGKYMNVVGDSINRTGPVI